MKKIIKSVSILTMSLFLTLALGSSTVKAESQNEINIDEIIANMSQEEKFGQLLMPDFRNWTVDGKEIPFTKMNDEVRKVIADYKLGGVILFRENVSNTEQTTRLTDNLQKSVSNDIPLMITIDQEGGLVTRLQTGTNMPGNMALGAARDPELTREVSKAIGDEVHSLGINVNFAPSVDVNSNYLNPVIGIRSFGSDVDLVSQMGVSYIRGLQDAKVAGSAKHFPGHGDTATDSHFGLPIVDKSLEEFKAVDLKPFEAAVDAGVDMLMTAHIVVPALDDSKIITKDGIEMGTPATLSKKILTDLVRNEMKYDGIVITDALNMKAISDNFTEPETVVETLSAGADIALMPTSIRKPSDVAKLDAIYDALHEAVAKGVISQKKIDKSVHRVLTLKKDREILNNRDARTVEERINDALNIVGSKSHKEIERRAAEKAVTLIKNENGTLPLRLKENTTVQILASHRGRSNLMELQMNNIIEKNGVKNVIVKQHVFIPKQSLTNDDKMKIDEADYVIMETMNLSSSSIYAPEVVEYSNKTNANLVVMSTRNPYDIMYMGDVKANIAVYGSSGYDQTQQGEAALPINIPAGMDVIFGEANPEGKLPVSIPNLNEEGNLYDFGHGLSYTEEESEVDKVSGQLAALPAKGKVVLTDKETIEAGRNAYDALTEEQKALVNVDALDLLTNAEAELKALEEKATEDQATADRVSDQLAKLPAKGKVMLTDKETIKAGRNAYDALTEEQKALVNVDALALLINAEAEIIALEEQTTENQATADRVSDQLATLPAKGKVVLTDKETIEAGRNAYDALTEEQKALINVNTLALLINAEAELKVLEEQATEDQATADKVSAQLATLPAKGKVALTDKETIEARRNAYDALIEDQKALVNADALALLINAEAELKVLEEQIKDDQATDDQATADRVSAQLATLPTKGKVALTDKETIEARRNSYDALTEEQKALVNVDALALLINAEAELKILEEQTTEDQVTADKVSDQLATLPAKGKVVLTDKEIIEVGRNAYDALTEEQKALVSVNTLALLINAEAELKILEEQTTENQATADRVSDQLATLPAKGKVVLTDKEIIEVGRKAYDALTEEQKALVNIDALTLLTNAEAELKVLEEQTTEDQATADRVSAQLATLPEKGKVTLTDKETIKAGRKAYDGLTGDQKVLVNADALALLVNAEAELKVLENQLAENETKPETRPETKPETRPETKPETRPETKPETRPETKPETRPETKPETKSEIKSEKEIEGERLPQTATATWTLGTLGLTSLLAGVIVYFRKKKNLKKG